MIERVVSWSRGCLIMQGYGDLSEEQRRSLWIGLRFSPALCFAGIALGTALASPALLLAMAATALIGGFLTPKHPFDYVYDAALRPLLAGPSVPSSLVGLPSRRPAKALVVGGSGISVRVSFPNPFPRESPPIRFGLFKPWRGAGAVERGSLENWIRLAIQFRIYGEAKPTPRCEICPKG